MFTRDNLKELLAKLDEEDIINTVNDDGDYINVIVSGYGRSVSVESVDTPDISIIHNGNLSADKDDFLRLLKETDNLPDYFGK